MPNYLESRWKEISHVIVLVVVDDACCPRIISYILIASAAKAETVTMVANTISNSLEYLILSGVEMTFKSLG